MLTGAVVEVVVVVVVIVNLCVWISIIMALTGQRYDLPHFALVSYITCTFPTYTYCHP